MISEYSEFPEKEIRKQNLRLECLKIVQSEKTVSMNMFVGEADKLFNYLMNGKSKEEQKP